MSEYVPYEVRRRQEAEGREGCEAEDAAWHAAALARTMVVLGALRGAQTDYHVEMLKPAGALTRLLTRKTKVTKESTLGGPNFVIDSVLPAYRVPGGIHRPHRKESGFATFDAYVVPDGRVWAHAGARADENVLQQLAVTALALRELSPHDLERIERHLSSLE